MCDVGVSLVRWAVAMTSLVPSGTTLGAPLPGDQRRCVANNAIILSIICLETVIPDEPFIDQHATRL